MSAAGYEVAIVPARGDDDMATVVRLFREYQISIGVDLSFQGFEEELGMLPGVYAAPRGEILMARVGRAAAGVVALRPLAGDDSACEMKRLYVRPAFRAAKLGRRLAEAILTEARRAGYRRIVLDTIESLFAGLNNTAVLRAELRRLFSWFRERGITAVIVWVSPSSRIVRPTTSGAPPKARCHRPCEMTTVCSSTSSRCVASAARRPYSGGTWSSERRSDVTRSPSTRSAPWASRP